MNYTNDVRTPNGYSALSIVKNGSIKVDNPSFPNYKLNFNYLKNGTIYSPEKVMFFNFSFIDNDTEIISKLENKSLFSIEIGMYFYLFKAINATYKQLTQSQNKTYSND